MESDSESIDSREGQLLDMRDLNDYGGSDRRTHEERHPANLQLGHEKVERPVHDSSLLSQFFWGPDDEEMESRPPDRKRKNWKRYAKMKGAANARNAASAAAETSENCTHWHDLPMELLVRVLTLVDNRTVVTASGVCRGWRDSVGQGIHDLSFSWCGQSVSNLVQSVAPKFPRLQLCRLKRCMHLSDAAIQTASRNWPGLRTLELSDGVRLTDAALFALADGCPKLEKLDLSNCRNITEAGLLAIVQNCHNLRHLNLWGCTDAGTDRVLQELAKHCTALQSLNLGWCGQISDKGILAFTRGCSDLRVIDLCRCSLITDQSVSYLAEQCHYLCALGLSTCPNLTDASMYTLISSKERAATAAHELQQQQHQQSQQKKRQRTIVSVKSLDSVEFRVPLRHKVHTGTSSCSSSGSTCSDASKLPIKREGLDTLLEENPNQQGYMGLVCLNVSHCESLSAKAVQAVCDAFPDLHTCAEQQSLVTSGCLNLSSVNCVCAIEARRDKSKRERRMLFPL